MVPTSRSERSAVRKLGEIEAIEALGGILVTNRGNQLFSRKVCFFFFVVVVVAVVALGGLLDLEMFDVPNSHGPVHDIHRPSMPTEGTTPWPPHTIDTPRRHLGSTQGTKLWKNKTQFMNNHHLSSSVGL